MPPFQTVAVIIVAAVLGIGSAWLAVVGDVGFESIRVGAWTAWPTAGASNSDPYIRARFARTGELPISAAEGAAFVAREDSGGEPLTGKCDYLVTGRTPAAQWWTLTLYRDADLSLIENPTDRYSFNSTDILRKPDGAFDVVVSAKARPGNWLPGDERVDRLRLVFRLYDTPIATGGSVADIEMPAIERGGCR
ncbi:DUF1214 domain-containing protein [Microbaculum marinisediminis]|uniref:DUF1214 domain-containing protein n=1 Tax=Microbaculum marinisediminis TaxID=2931392 RepID=A0AAW5QXU7_9HYPH|nr:DUF1214 domain-containing protein [Microbaculum sp. A6E488]MCT8971233.1 DUF1214 domain-containing protein [Microbaculum sp. A6E488]